MTTYGSEMRLFDPVLGQRLYMDAQERERFLHHSNELTNRQHRLFCHVLHWSGARISEILALTGQRIDFDRQTITFQTLKKRKFTQKGELKAPVFRQVPIPPELLNSIVSDPRTPLFPAPNQPAIEPPPFNREVVIMVRGPYKKVDSRSYV